MNYVDPVSYSKKILALMEDEMPEVEEVVPVKGKKTMKERLSELTPDEKQKLKEYMDALKEIKKEVYELLHKNQVEEVGGNMSSDLTMPIKEEIDLNEYDQLLGAIENLLSQGETSQNILRVVKDTLGMY
jgi:mevalonate kinase